MQMEPAMRFFPALLALALILSPAAQAQQDWRDVDWGDFIVRAGGTYVHPKADSSTLQFSVLQHWDLFRTKWDQDSDTTWNISAAWRPTEHWGVEFVQLFDAHYDVDLLRFNANPGRDSIKLGRYSARSSNLFVNWYPLGPNCLGRPYFGVGVNYTDFRSEHLDREFNHFLVDTDLATGIGDLSLGYSWGWAGQIGMDLTYNSQSPWLANIAVLYFDSDTKTRVTFPTKPGTDHFRAQLNYDPWVLNLGVGYKF